VPENLSGFIAWVRGCLLMFSFVLPLLFSCTGTPDIKESRAFQIIESVPFYPQEAYQCGPASLACVLNYWRTGVSPEDVAGEIYSESAKGTLDIDMILYAERKGLKARQYKGSADDIKRNIDLGYPLIVLVDYGFWVYQQNHFMVVVGYNKNGILANSGRDQLKFIPFKVFLKSWKRTNFWTMLIRPKQ
jgi:ABC-type bacteriocin/lantibiotic exporter with double-glycine peptidase domain